MNRRLVVVATVVALLSVLSVGAFAQSTNSDAWIPGIASFLIPGLGQLLNGQMDRAILFFGVDIAIIVGGGYISTIAPYGYLGYSVVGLAHLAWSLYSGFDAYNVAKDNGFRFGITSDGLTLAYRF